MRSQQSTPSDYSKHATLAEASTCNCATSCTGTTYRYIAVPTLIVQLPRPPPSFTSFEWYLGYSSWRASAHIWNPESYYRHSKSTELILSDAGWHCSYCFRSIPEYVMKMKGFSHADRIGGRINLLDPKRIQDTICRGRDIFGMLPEAYSVSWLGVVTPSLCSDPSWPSVY